MCERVVNKRPALGERQNGWRRAFRWKNKVAVGRRTTGDLPVDHPFFNAVIRNERAADCEPGVGVGSALDAQLSKRMRKTADMAIEIDKPAIENRHDFVDRVREEEAPVEHGDLALGFGDVVAV